MPKKKIVMKVAMNNNNNKARKAMKIAAGVCGVESMTLMGSDKDQIAVTGEDIDAVELAKLLRKNVGCAEIVSVGPLEEKKPVATTTTAANTTSTSQTQALGMLFNVYPPNYTNYGVRYHVYDAPCDTYDSSCTIL